MMNNFARISQRALRPIMLHSMARQQPISIVRSSLLGGSYYKAIGILAAIQIGATLFGTYVVDQQITMTVADYMENGFLKENQQFQIVGIIKLGSISIQRGTLDVKFTLTDFDHDVNVFYRGQTKFEFKEGETMVLTAYLPDKKDKTKIIGVNYMTKHSMDGNLWQDKVGVDRQNFGLNSKVQVLN